MMARRNKQTRLVTMLDFSGIYDEESFYRGAALNRIDCRAIEGTCGFCSPEAETALRGAIAPFSVRGVHLIDSGNYHYVTKLWLEKVETPFHLVVFDHHTDMQTPNFGTLLSCGSWISKTLRENKYLQKVFLLGTAKKQRNMADPIWQDRLFCFDESTIDTPFFWKTMKEEKETLPFYISIDKDVMDEGVVKTDWDQGKLSFGELKELLHLLIKKHEILGLDICGECALLPENLEEIANDDRFNKNLLKFLEAEEII